MLLARTTSYMTSRKIRRAGPERAQEDSVTQLALIRLTLPPFRQCIRRESFAATPATTRTTPINEFLECRSCVGKRRGTLTRFRNRGVAATQRPYRQFQRTRTRSEPTGKRVSFCQFGALLFARQCTLLRLLPQHRSNSACWYRSGKVRQR